MHLDQEDTSRIAPPDPAMSRCRRRLARRPASRRATPPPRRAGPSPRAATTRRERSRSAHSEDVAALPHANAGTSRTATDPLPSPMPPIVPHSGRRRCRLRSGHTSPDRPGGPGSSAARSAAAATARCRAAPGSGPRSCRPPQSPDGRRGRPRAGSGPPSRSSAPDRRARARCRRTLRSRFPRSSAVPMRESRMLMLDRRLADAADAVMVPHLRLADRRLAIRN